MALNPIAFTEKVVRSFLRYQLTAYPFADEGLYGQMRLLLSLDETRKLPLLKGPYISVSRIPPGTWEPQLNEGQSMMSQRGFPLDPPDIIERLVNTIKQIPEDDRPPALSVIRDIIGDPAAAELIADLDDPKSCKVSETSAPYEPSTKKMTQMGLFD